MSEQRSELFEQERKALLLDRNAVIQVISALRRYRAACAKLFACDISERDLKQEVEDIEQCY